MPANVNLGHDELEDLVSKAGGLEKETLKKRKYALDDFKMFVTNQSRDFDALLQSNADFEEICIQYFTGLRVKNASGELDLPKKNYVLAIKSHLKIAINEYTAGHIDITDNGRFPSLQKAFKGLYKKLKENGKGDTAHYEELPEKHLTEIFKLLAAVQGVMAARKNKDREAYEQAKNHLPVSYHENYHMLMQCGAQFILTLYNCRRGRQGISFMTRNHFAKKYVDGQYFYVKVQGEKTKNHGSDSEDVGSGGIILFQEDQFGFSPGLFFELFQSFLNNDSEYLFQTPKKKSKKIDIDDLESNELYLKSKVGENIVGGMMPKLCEVLSLDRFTNHCCRVTGIRILKRLGYEDRAIMAISGHKSVESLCNYDPKPTITVRADMARGIQGVQAEIEDNSFAIERNEILSEAQPNNALVEDFEEMEEIVDMNQELQVSSRRADRDQGPVRGHIIVTASQERIFPSLKTASPDQILLFRQQEITMQTNNLLGQTNEVLKIALAKLCKD